MRTSARERVVAQVKQYTAVAERDGRYWMVTVPELDRVTQARNLAEVDEMARDLISLMEDVPADSFEIKPVIKLPGQVQKHVNRARELRQKELQIRAESASEIRIAARTMAETGMQLKDIGKSLGVSYQRASQLLKDEASGVKIGPASKRLASGKVGKRQGSRTH